MSKPLLNPGLISTPPALRPGQRPSALKAGSALGIIDDPIALALKAVADAYTEALRVNTVAAWSDLDELVGELKHLTHLKFIEARQAAAAGKSKS